MAALNCPSCASLLPLPGGRLVRCPGCGAGFTVAGDLDVPRWVGPRAVDHDQALRVVKGFLTTPTAAPDLVQKTQIRRLRPVLVPYWRVRADAAASWGYMSSGKNASWQQGFEHSRLEWVDAACEAGELGVSRVPLAPDDRLVPFDAVSDEALVYAPMESVDPQIELARGWLVAKLTANRSEAVANVVLVGAEVALVYHPLWLGQYDYRGRSYSVVVDGHASQLLYGVAPQRTLARAAALVGGLAFGNLVAVYGTMAAMTLASATSDDGSPCAGMLVPLVGVALVSWGYHRYRFGALIERRHPDTIQ